MKVAADGEPIYAFVRARLDPAGRLADPTVELPDEAKRAGRVKWVAGGADGVGSVHGLRDSDSADQARVVCEVIARLARRDRRRHRRDLYDLLAKASALELADPLLELLAQEAPDRANVHEIGVWLVAEAPDREPVKIGLALLGATGVGSDVGLVRALGAHEEFTLFAAVALKNGLVEPDAELWALASAVQGWGRIQCVNRLRGTSDPAIRSWILREGFRNSIMDEYLAFVAATTGDLLGALRESEPDREMLTAAGEILAALIAGGPAEDLDDYVDGADAVESFLAHMQAQAHTLEDFHAVTAIRTFLQREDGWEERGVRGWTATRREAFEALCEEILGRREWIDRVAVGLLSDDAAELWKADHAARELGIDTFDVWVQQVRNDPLSGAWFQAWRQAGEGRAAFLVELARALLPLGAVPTGACDELGLGPDWRVHQAFDWTLQALRHHEGVGGDLLLIGLRSPVTRNRNMALKALEEWSPAAWPSGALDHLNVVARSDPNDRTRELAVELLTLGAE
jgi:hypothetical protein